MIKVYVYKMHAGSHGTEETHVHVGEGELTPSEQWEWAKDHAESYGNEFDGDEWSEGSEPEMWLIATVTTLAELEAVSPEVLCGSETLKDLIASVERDGMVFCNE